MCFLSTLILRTFNKITCWKHQYLIYFYLYLFHFSSKKKGQVFFNENNLINGAMACNPFSWSNNILLFHLLLKPLDPFGKQYCPSPTLHVSLLIYKITILWKFRLNQTSESGENNRKTHSCFRAFRRVMTCVYNKSVILANENLYCFTVFSESKAFHGLIFQEKSFTITFCKPCKLFVNLWTFFFLSVPKGSNGFNGNNSVRTRSSLRGNDLGWWLALFTDLASGSVH